FWDVLTADAEAVQSSNGAKDDRERDRDGERDRKKYLPYPHPDPVPHPDWGASHHPIRCSGSYDRGGAATSRVVNGNDENPSRRAMPEIISCPECQRKLRVPDHLLGKKVKCPGCGTLFKGQGRGAEDTPKTSVRAAAPREERIEEKPRAGRRSVVPPPEEEYAEDRPRRRRRDEDDEDEDYPRTVRGSDELNEEDAADEAERGLSPRQQREGWKKVGKGISFILVSIWVMLGGMAVSWLLTMIIGMAGIGAVSSAKTGGQAVGALATTGAGFVVLMIVS